MKIVYEILFEVEIEHGYYKKKLSSDFVLSPTPECTALLARFKLIFRETKFGFKVFAPVEPDTNPAKLLYPFDDQSLKFSFQMQLQNSYFESITDIPDFDPRKLFYFSNLREDIDNQLLYLSDQISAQRIGVPVKNISTIQFTYTLQTPQNAATFQLEDIFGKELPLAVPSFQFTNPSDEADTFQQNLSEVKKIQPGRYLMTDDHGGNLPFYYNPGLFGRNVFGVIEIYNNTSSLTVPSENRVPATYRFSDNGNITGKGKYRVGFSPSQVKWMYVCRKNPLNSGNGITVDKLSVEGPVTFSKSGGDDVEERKILSDNKIVSNEASVNVILKNNGVKIRDLPNPETGSICKKENSEVFFEVYIYV